jgi:hypothetical protein
MFSRMAHVRQSQGKRPIEEQCVDFHFVYYATKAPDKLSTSYHFEPILSAMNGSLQCL